MILARDLRDLPVKRGFRGICIVGVNEDGFAANWHRQTDITLNIVPESLECAARFAWEMIQQIDRAEL